MRSHGSGRGFFRVNSDDINIFSCYITLIEPIKDLYNKIDALEDCLMNTNGQKIMAGDSNSRTFEWGPPETKVHKEITFWT